MALLRASVLYPLLLFAFVVFLFFTKAPEADDGQLPGQQHHGSRRGLRVKLHNATAAVNPKMDHITFDPVVAQYEQRHDDREWEKRYIKHHEEVMQRIRRHHEREVIDENIAARREELAERAELYGLNNEEEKEEEGEEHHEEEEEEEETEEDGEDFDDSEDYFSYDHFNITSRLQVLFPAIDSIETDGLITVDELTKWHVQQGRGASLHRTEREIESLDTNHDSLVSLKEHLHDESPGDALSFNISEEENEWMRNAVEQFPLADLNGDGLLDREEFQDFLHPEDSENPKLQQWLRKNEIKSRDGNHDGKLSFDEFYNELYNELRDFGEEDPVDTAVRSHVGKDPHESRTNLTDAMETKVNRSRAKFEELDKNKDGFLTEDEIEPVMNKLQPGEKFFAYQQAEHMVDQADEDGDKKLSLAEMIKHPYVFYNVAYEEEDEEDFSHDEFRR